MAVGEWTPLFTDTTRELSFILLCIELLFCLKTIRLAHFLYVLNATQNPVSSSKSLIVIYYSHARHHATTAVL